MKKIENFNIGVYGIYSPKNDLLYIGCSSNLSRRYYEHCSGLLSNNHANVPLRDACLVYGFENLTFKTIMFCNEEDLYYYEKFYIKILSPICNGGLNNNSIDLSFYYNSCNEYKAIIDYITSFNPKDKVKTSEIILGVEKEYNINVTAKKVGTMLRFFGYKCIRLSEKYGGRIFVKNKLK